MLAGARFIRQESRGPVAAGDGRGSPPVAGRLMPLQETQFIVLVLHGARDWPSPF